MKTYGITDSYGDELVIAREESNVLAQINQARIVIIGPDRALDLAAALIRMVNDILREENENGNR